MTGAGALRHCWRALQQQPVAGSLAAVVAADWLPGSSADSSWPGASDLAAAAAVVVVD